MKNLIEFRKEVCVHFDALPTPQLSRSVYVKRFSFTSDSCCVYLVEEASWLVSWLPKKPCQFSKIISTISPIPHQGGRRSLKRRAVFCTYLSDRHVMTYLYSSDSVLFRGQSCLRYTTQVYITAVHEKHLRNDASSFPVF